jgi:hypothetical protein
MAAAQAEGIYTDEDVSRASRETPPRHERARDCPSWRGVAIITGDQDLLILDPFRDIRVLAPSAFWKWESEHYEGIDADAQRRLG